jgi:hypothetical protein
MTKFDPNEILALLNIVEKISTVMPQLTHLSAEAASELRELDAELERRHRERNGIPPVPPQAATIDERENNTNELRKALAGPRAFPSSSEPDHTDQLVPNPEPSIPLSADPQTSPLRRPLVTSTPENTNAYA